MYILILNIVLYFVTLVYVAKKDSFISIRVFILFLYFLFALMGFITVSNGIFFETFGVYSLAKLSIIPYLVNYIMVIILLSSLRSKIINNNITMWLKATNVLNSKLLLTFENIVMVVCIVFLMLLFIGILQNGILSYGVIYEASRIGERAVFFENKILNALFFRSYKFLSFVVPFFYVIKFSKYVCGYKKKQCIMHIFIMLCCLVAGCIVRASRGGVFFVFLNFLFFVLCFWDYIAIRTKKLFSIGMGIALIAVNFFVNQISEDRFETDNVATNNIRYFGEAFPNLGLRIWDISDEHILGARKFPTLFQFFGGYIPDFNNDYDYKMMYFESKYKYPVNNFKTLFGDLYIEFGLTLSILFFLLCVGILRLFYNKAKHSCLSIIYLYIVYELVTFGLFGLRLDETYIIEYVLYFVVILILKKRFQNNFYNISLVKSE